MWLTESSSPFYIFAHTWIYLYRFNWSQCCVNKSARYISNGYDISSTVAEYLNLRSWNSQNIFSDSAVCNTMRGKGLHVIDTHGIRWEPENTINSIIWNCVRKKWASRAHSRFAPSQWETALLCNDVSHWLGASLESALSKPHPILTVSFYKEMMNPTFRFYKSVENFHSTQTLHVLMNYWSVLNGSEWLANAQ